MTTTVSSLEESCFSYIYLLNHAVLQKLALPGVTPEGNTGLKLGFYVCAQDQSFTENTELFTENTEFDEPGAASFQRGFRGGKRRFMDEGEEEYGRDSDIPPGPGNMDERPFGDRPLPGPGRERFKEQWDFREVLSYTAYITCISCV